MTKQEFEELQLQFAQSGKTLKLYLHQINLKYSNYNYWRTKFKTANSHNELAPISIKSGKEEPAPVFNGQMPCGATLVFPNGVRAHFGTGTEDVLLKLLKESISPDVLP
ncbi:hypothetical protein LPYR103PRE_21440 [Segatella asaccharophila]